MITFWIVLPDYNRIRLHKPEAKPNVCCRSRWHHYQRLHHLDLDSGYLVVVAFAENKPCMKTNMSRADSINKDLSLLVASPDELQKLARVCILPFVQTHSSIEGRITHANEPHVLHHHSPPSLPSSSLSWSVGMLGLGILVYVVAERFIRIHYCERSTIETCKLTFYWMLGLGNTITKSFRSYVWGYVCLHVLDCIRLLVRVFSSRNFQIFLTYLIHDLYEFFSCNFT